MQDLREYIMIMSVSHASFEAPGSGMTTTEDTLYEVCSSKMEKGHRIMGAKDDEKDEDRALFVQNVVDPKQAELKRI